MRSELMRQASSASVVVIGNPKGSLMKIEIEYCGE
jgi:hypothetical protein